MDAATRNFDQGCCQVMGDLLTQPNMIQQEQLVLGWYLWGLGAFCSGMQLLLLPVNIALVKSRTSHLIFLHYIREHNNEMERYLCWA